MAARKVKPLEDQGYSALEAYCIGLNEYYKALRKAGFAVDICISMIQDPISYPDWILPKRISYIIFDGKIASPILNWKWRKYTGINKHNHHMHVSFKKEADLLGEFFQIPMIGGSL